MNKLGRSPFKLQASIPRGFSSQARSTGSRCPGPLQCLRLSIWSLDSGSGRLCHYPPGVHGWFSRMSSIKPRRSFSGYPGVFGLSLPTSWPLTTRRLALHVAFPHASLTYVLVFMQSCTTSTHVTRDSCRRNSEYILVFISTTYIYASMSLTTRRRRWENRGQYWTGSEAHCNRL